MDNDSTPAKVRISDGLGLNPGRAAFEADAAKYGFDIERSIAYSTWVGEPWHEYAITDVGHRYAGFIAAWDQQQLEIDRLRGALLLIRGRLMMENPHAVTTEADVLLLGPNV